MDGGLFGSTSYYFICAIVCVCVCPSCALPGIGQDLNRQMDPVSLQQPTSQLYLFTFPTSSISVLLCAQHKKTSACTPFWEGVFQQ